MGQELVHALEESGVEMNDAVINNNISNNKPHIDLKEINRQTLIKLDVPANNIEKTDYCTYTYDKLFFSARRQSIHSGRMLTGIMLK